MESTLPQLAERLQAAQASGQLSAGAVANIEIWLREPRYADYVPLVADHIIQGDWQTLDDVFWTVIPFGTGGRRGRMYPIGCNAINERTIGESAQGLADYVRQHQVAPFSCAIAYDTRHRSDEFARLCAEIMLAAGFRVYFLRPFRSTPELSFVIRHFGCSCGIMVTASHNPPSDNAVKVYWSTGGQLLPPHDQGVIDAVGLVTTIARSNFDDAVSRGLLMDATQESDKAFVAAVVRQSFSGPRNLAIMYSPLHGVGGSAVLPVLKEAGFNDVRVFADHAEPNGDFPNVPQHVANPENPAVFDVMIREAQDRAVELILATDPDCDRLGIAAPVTLDPSGPWGTLTGNQIGALLTDFVLRARQQAGRLNPRGYIVKTLVTTDLIRKIADAYGVRTIGELHVGFKWIGGAIDEAGPGDFLFGAEESHGYLVGDYARDKDGAVASLLAAEMAAHCKAQGRSLHEELSRLFVQFGYHAERLINQQMPGSNGMAKMQAIMQRLRHDPPTTWAGESVIRIRDYRRRMARNSDGSESPLTAPAGDLVFLDLDLNGNSIAVRPSGTEPKIKFYLFAVGAPGRADITSEQRLAAARLDAWTEAVRQRVSAVD